MSIVVPVWNRAEFTARCLDALARTVDRAAVEVIVVDNASTDATTELLRRPPRPVRVIANTENAGFARASNQGARAARGSLLVFLNNDTEPEPGWIEALEAATRDEQVGVVGARLLYPATRRIQHAGLAIGPDGVPDHLWRNAPADDPRAAEPCDLDMVTGACLAIRRSLFLELGGFDEGYVNGAEDVDLCLAVRRAGLRVRYEPRAVVLHHEGATEGRFDAVASNLARLAERWGDTLRAMPRRARADFGSPPGPLVAWEGAFFKHHSLARVNRELARELLAAGVDLTLTPWEAADFDPASVPGGAELARLVDRPARESAAVRVRHRFPPDFTRRPGERLVVMQPWEFGAAPVEWVEGILASVDELWVPSDFVRRSFVEGGVPSSRVVTIPHGFDPRVFNEAAEPLPLPTAKSFRFLYVGGSIHRKGYDLVLRAYAEEFGAADDVCLVVKDHSYYAHRLDEPLAAIRGQAGAPEILYFFDDVAPGRMASFYAAADWLVHPFRGEGFGLPMLESLACGRPVIVTDAGPSREFCPGSAALFVPAQLARFAEPRIDYLATVGVPYLAEPDLGALRAAMRRAYVERGRTRERGHAGAAHVHARYTWAILARTYAERFRAVLARPPLTASVPRSSRGDTARDREPVTRGQAAARVALAVAGPARAGVGG